MGTMGDIRGKEAIFFATHFSFYHSFLVPTIRPYLTSGLEAGGGRVTLRNGSRV